MTYLSNNAICGIRFFRQVFSSAVFKQRSQLGPQEKIILQLNYPPIITVGSPLVILFGGPTASKIVSPCRAAGIPAIITVADGVMTTPGPCGGIGKSVRQA